MPHDIIDNQSVFLGDAVRPFLDQSERAHFAVGYFVLRACLKIRPVSGPNKYQYSLFKLVASGEFSGKLSPTPPYAPRFAGAKRRHESLNNEN